MVSRAVTAPKQSLSQEELNAMLVTSGYASPPGERQQRIKLDGSIFKTSDTEEMFVYNPKHPEIPAFTARIVKPVEDYMAIFIDDAIATAFGRSDLAGTFSKHYFQEDPERRLWPSDEVYDELVRRNDIVDGKGQPVKASWKGDLLLQIIPDDGALKGDETPYVLTLSTTSLIEFRGASRTPEAGSISEFNFMQKLVRFAAENAPEGVEPSRAVLDALSSYSMGGVVAEFRTATGYNKDKSVNWQVVVADPVHIEPMATGDNLLSDGENPDEVGL